MKTIYILHGGNASHVNAENDAFFSEMLKYTSNEVKILLVEFAGSEEKRAQHAQEDKAQFERVARNKKVAFAIATEQNFLNQVKDSDVIYLRGGTTVRLLENLRRYENLDKLFGGKVIAGESAGANSLSAYCYSKSGGGIIPGLGLVPVRIIPHYKKGMETHFANIASDLELVLLPEYAFKVFEREQ